MVANPSESGDDGDGGRPLEGASERDGAVWRQGLIDASSAGDGGARPALSGRAGHGHSWSERHWTSRTLHRLGEVAAHSTAGLVASGTIVAWALVGVATKFPDWWETVLYATSSSVTLVMVFAIQHTQTRQQSATQRKLDELLRSQASADNRLISVEEAPDAELEARATLNLAERQAECPDDAAEG
ncbi:hypothetical protein BH18ACT1_BH18ACT1_10090 [soil metagenome]